MPRKIRRYDVTLYKPMDYIKDCLILIQWNHKRTRCPDILWKKNALLTCRVVEMLIDFIHQNTLAALFNEYVNKIIEHQNNIFIKELLKEI